MPKLDYISIAQAFGEEKELQVPLKEQKVFTQIWDIASGYESKFESAKSYEKLNQIIEKKNAKNNRVMWLAAASVLVVLGAIFFALNSNNSIQFATEPGVNQNLNLEDNSRINLYGGSLLTLDKDFNTDNRIILFEGVAHFDVTKNTDKPFTIQTDKGTITVLGTTFTVHAEEESDRFAIDVFEGKVKVQSKDETAILIQGMHLEVTDDGKFLISQGKKDIPYSMTQFNFVDTKVIDIIKEIENQFGVSIEFKSSVAMERITLKTKADNADKLLRIISETLGSEFKVIQP